MNRKIIAAIAAGVTAVVGGICMAVCLVRRRKRLRGDGSYD